MRLPEPPLGGYSREQDQRRNRILELADGENLKTGRDNYIGDGRLILTDDRGVHYEVYVDVDGCLKLRTVEENAEMACNSYDAFGRLRTSDPTTLFDSKQLHDNAPLYWDDSEVSGASTTSTHSTARAATEMGVALNTAGKRVRQTFQRFNYQPGKSQQVLCTGILDRSGGGSGITAAMGYFDDDNGIFVEIDDGTCGMTIRTSVSGSAVDTTVTQANWNGDKLDGTGASGHTLDLSKAQIWWCDIEWLGVGTVRTGFVIEGKFILCHSFHHSNDVTAVYMSTPNLPVRYEIENDGTGPASTMEHICSTVVSEGGLELKGVVRYKSTEGTHVDANTANSIYAIVGLRLKSAQLDEIIDLVSMSMIVQTSDDFEWLVLVNPTVAGTFTYSDETNSACQTAVGDSTNTVTGGTPIGGGFVKASVSGGTISAELDNALRLGSAIDGTPDEIVLCCRPLANNADVEGSLTWREATG